MRSAMAMGMEAQVTVIDRSLDAAARTRRASSARSCNTIYSTVDAIEHYVREADLVIGAVLVPGAAAPEAGDPQDDQVDAAGLGAWSTSPSTRAAASRPATPPPTPSRPTWWTASCTTASPTCRARSPRTSTFALNNATLPFGLALADKGVAKACAEDPHLLNGLNIHDGKITYKAVAEALGKKYVPAAQALGL